MPEVNVDVPKYGMGMTEATLVEWLVSIGEAVEAGAPIAKIETDKVDMDVEAPVAGTLTAQLVDEGNEFDVPGTIARINSDS